MSKRINELFLFDIYVAIVKIEQVSSLFSDSNELLDDFVSWDSIIREFEIIGEAAKILIEFALIDSKYRVVVDFRNKITHHYFGIDAEAVWNIIENNLPEFKDHIKNRINNMDPILCQDLLNSCKVDNIKYPSILLKLEQIKTCPTN